LKALDDLIITQYTTVDDSDGKNIYVGDIIKHEFPKALKSYSKERLAKCDKPVLVRFSQEQEDNHPGYRLYDLTSQYGKIKIIGNIFENPELLEKNE
jgi:uncharacterized phage protein (TIGR01671 family)